MSNFEMRRNGMKKVFKRLPALLLALGLTASLAACGAETAETPDPAETTPAATPKPTESMAPVKTPAPTPAEVLAPTPAETPAPVEIEYRDVDVNALVDSGANIVHTATYGIYTMEGDDVDSAIKADVYYDLDKAAVVRIDFEEALLPAVESGAQGWAVLDEETAAKLGDAVIIMGEVVYPARFELGGVEWTGAAGDAAVSYTASIDGQEQEFTGYVGTQEGGAWYHDNMGSGANLLTAAGETAATVEIGTKASINHGVDFWMSPITFPGNIELIKNFIYDNGVNYDYAPNSDIVKNEAGQWVVADTVTGATLAGTPNYLNLVKAACDQIAAGEYTVVE